MDPSPCDCGCSYLVRWFVPLCVSELQLGFWQTQIQKQNLASFNGERLRSVRWVWVQDSQSRRDVMVAMNPQIVENPTIFPNEGLGDHSSSLQIEFAYPNLWHLVAGQVGILQTFLGVEASRPAIHPNVGRTTWNLLTTTKGSLFRVRRHRGWCLNFEHTFERSYVWLRLVRFALSILFFPVFTRRSSQTQGKGEISRSNDRNAALKAWFETTYRLSIANMQPHYVVLMEEKDEVRTMRNALLQMFVKSRNLYTTSRAGQAGGGSQKGKKL